MDWWYELKRLLGASDLDHEVERAEAGDSDPITIKNIINQLKPYVENNSPKESAFANIPDYQKAKKEYDDIKNKYDRLKTALSNLPK